MDSCGYFGSVYGQTVSLVSLFKGLSQPAQGRTVTWAYFFTRKVNCPSLQQPGKGWTDVIFIYIGISIISALKLLSNFLIENKPSSHHQINNNEVNNGAIDGRTNADLQNILINITSSPAIDRATMSMKRSTARAATWLVSSERIHNIRLVRGRYTHLLTHWHSPKHYIYHKYRW
jgi:hypothetical protein